MNSQEAINQINTFRCKFECNTDGIYGCDTKEGCEFYLAINALETLDKIKDLITTQEALFVEIESDEFPELEAYYAIKEILRDE